MFVMLRAALHLCYNQRNKWTAKNVTHNAYEESLFLFFHVKQIHSISQGVCHCFNVV